VRLYLKKKIKTKGLTGMVQVVSMPGTHETLGSKQKTHKTKD
jgi:hypothetical protein